MSKNKKRGHKSKAQDIAAEQSTNENGTACLEACSNKQNCSDGISTAEDTLIQPATDSCQNALLEEESPANLLTLKPQDLALSPIECPLEENMLGKKKKKKRSKKICTKTGTNLEVVPHEAESCAHWLPSEHQELHTNNEANTFNRKQKTKKNDLNIPTSGDVDANITALRPGRPLVLEVESAANLLSLNGQELVLNALGNRSKENMSGEKKKDKKSQHICTEAMTSPEVVPSKAESSVRLPAPELQDDMNIEVNTSKGKQEKRKKSKLNIPTSDAVGVDTTAQHSLLHEVESAAVMFSPKPQDIDLNPLEKNLEKNMSGKKKRKKKRSGKVSTEAIPDSKVVPPEAEDSLQLPASGLQDLDAVGVNTSAQPPLLLETESAAVMPSLKPQDIGSNPVENNLEENISGKKKKKKKKKKRCGKISTEAIPDAVVPYEAEDSLQLPAPGLQDLDAVGVNTTAQPPLLLEIESAAVMLSPKPQDIDSNPVEKNLEENMSEKKKRKKKRSGKFSTEAILDADAVPPEAEDSLQLPAPGLQDLDAVGVKTTAQPPLLLEIESAAVMLSPKPQDIDSNPVENNLEGIMSGKKKRKKKRSGKFSTEAIPDAVVVPPEAADSLQLPTPGLQDLDMMIEANTSNRKHMGKKSKLNLPPSDIDVDTGFAQPLASEVESAANLFSLKPQDIGLNQIESNLEENMSGKKKRKKKKSERISTEANPNLEVSPPKVEDSVQFPAPEFQDPNVTEANTSNRKHKGKKSNLNLPACDVVGVTFPQQPLAREVETAANSLSPKLHDVVLNAMENHLEGDICGEKKRKKKNKSEIIPTQDIPNLEVLSPEAEGYEQLPDRELQGIDVKIETNSSNRKQEKRKINTVNKPTVDAAGVNMTSVPQPLAPEVESTESLLSLEPQDVILNPIKENTDEKKNKRSENTPTEVIPYLEVVPGKAVTYVQLPVTELQELDVHIEANSSNRKQKKRKRSKVNTATGDAVDVDATAPQPLALVIESTANLLSPEPRDVVLDPKNNTVNKPMIDAAGMKMTSPPQPLAADVESTEKLLSLEPQDVVLVPMEENIAEKKKKITENTSTEVIPNLEVVPSKAVTYVQSPVIELQELDVNTEANSSNRKRKKRKKSKVNTPACVAVDVDATAPQPLALVVESTANLLSPKRQDVVLDPMDNCMEELMAGKKKKKSENIPTEAISNLDVLPHKTEGSLHLPAPECQELDVNIEANSSNKKQKRKKNKVNKPTSNAVEVDTTSAPQSHALEHQEMVTNVTREMEETSSSGIKCSNWEGKKNQHKPTNDVDGVPSAHPPLPLELQENEKKLTKDLDEQSGSGQNSASEKRKRKKKKKNLTSNVIDTKSTGEVHVAPDNLERDTLSPINIEVNNDNGRKRKIGETDVELAAQVMEPENQDLTNKMKRRNVTMGEVEEVDNVKTEEIETLCADTIKMSSEDVPTNNALDVEKSAMSSENGLHLAFPEKNIVAESCIEGTCLSSSTGVTMDVNPCLRRKLLILDLNGLLADIIMPPPKGFKPDASFMRRAVFKRPFCDDFLKFCFERFDLAIWSSRSKRIIDRVVDYLLGDLKHKLLFCWDMSHATMTKFKTLENKDKPLVCKDLRKIWETGYPALPWKKGDYDESNTLLLDDSPYKALLNPAHTTIFPHSYNFMDKDKDNSLGPGGDLRVFLEKLADAEHVQKFVEQHPFGQPAICEKHPSWDFYSKVMRSLSPSSF
ncbi:unnamed protein product [Cuscuta campestris]|uniref:FCP1 homology domain-containing protein n=1 Tax=Cuscuta campestris TaxID=132261 RepID=A0A484LTH8_9ASTE|nr:unnamed protein product [Cuscuta campestris]